LRAATDSQNALHIHLFEIKLDKPVHVVDALSYAGGNYHPSVPLVVDDETHIMITENLAAALRCYRHADEDRYL
jgi:hypothetical protein